MAIYFETPTAPLVPAAVNPSHPGYDLFKHYRPWDAGINLFVVGGVVTTVEPDYAVTTPDRVYLGGHLYTVTQAEADLLTAAGYSVYVGSDPVVNPGLPGFEDVDGNTVLSPGEYGYAGYGDFEYGGTVGTGLPGFEDVHGDLPDPPVPTPDDPPRSERYIDIYTDIYGQGLGFPGFDDEYAGEYVDNYQESFL